MNISSPQIPSYLPIDQAQFSVRTIRGDGFRELSREELLLLIACNQVRAIVRGRRIHQLYLTVPPNAATVSLGDRVRRAGNALHGDANRTTQRSLATIATFHKKHHLYHCLNWNTNAAAR